MTSEIKGFHKSIRSYTFHYVHFLTTTHKFHNVKISQHGKSQASGTICIRPPQVHCRNDVEWGAVDALDITPVVSVPSQLPDASLWSRNTFAQFWISPKNIMSSLNPTIIVFTSVALIGTAPFTAHTALENTWMRLSNEPWHVRSYAYMAGHWYDTGTVRGVASLYLLIACLT